MLLTGGRKPRAVRGLRWSGTGEQRRRRHVLFHRDRWGPNSVACTKGNGRRKQRTAHCDTCRFCYWRYLTTNIMGSTVADEKLELCVFCRDLFEVLKHQMPPWLSKYQACFPSRLLCSLWRASYWKQLCILYFVSSTWTKRGIISAKSYFV